MNQHEVDHDEGVLFWVEKAANKAGLPPLVAMNLLQAAAEAGVMDYDWLRCLRIDKEIKNANTGNY